MGAWVYPDFARDALEKGELDERRCCKTLTYCTYLMRQKNHPLGQFPTGCPQKATERSSSRRAMRGAPNEPSVGLQPAD